MKRWQTTILTFIAVLAILIVTLALTPVGHEPARRIIEDVVRDASGYELSMSDLSGNLLSRIAATDVRLISGSGVPLVEADRIVVDFELLPVLSRTVSVPLLHFENAQVWFTVASDGRLVGWTDVPSGSTAAPPDTTTSSEPWEISAVVLFDGLAAVYADSAASLSVKADLDRLEAQGGIDAFDADLEGRVRYEGTPFERPLDVALSIAGGLEGTTVRVTSLELSTEAADVSATGSLAFPSTGLELDVEAASQLDTRRLAGLFGIDGMAGAATLRAAVDGPARELRYDATVRSDSLLLSGVALESVAADIEGHGGRATLTSLQGSALGGSFVLSGTADITRPSGSLVSFEAAGDRLALSAVPGARLSGTSSFVARGEIPLERLPAATGTLAVDVWDLRYEAWAFGDAGVRAGVGDGLARARAWCCSTDVTATAELRGAGVDSLSATVDAPDLGRIAALFGMEGLAGRATVDVRADSLPGDRLRYAAVMPELRYRGVSLGPVEVRGSALRNVYDLSWSLLDGVADGDASVDAVEGTYAAQTEIDGLQLGAVLSDSLLRAYDAEGALSLSATVEGSFDGDIAVSGTVSSLDGALRGERLELERSFSFNATNDGLRLSPVWLAGSFGTLGVSGTVSADDSLDLRATLDRLDLAVVDRVARGATRGPGVAGVVSGSLAVSGSRRSPVAVLDVSADSLNAAGVSFAQALVEADIDTSMVIFSVSAATEADGVLLANGLLPLRPDSAAVLALDTDREFALSLSAENFEADVGEALLTGTRGPKVVRLDGALLVTGLIDSLASLNGRGDLNELALSLAPARVALADSFSFEIDEGDVWLDNLALDITRTRVLSEASGGRLTVSGFVGVRDSIDVSARLDSLDVATIFRVVSPGPTAPVAGRLDLTGTVRGRLSAPSIDARWTMRKPVFAQFGFESFEGRIHAEDERVVLDHATLRTRTDSLKVTGAVGVAGVQGEALPIDFAVRSKGIDLSGLSSYPRNVDELEGVFTADLTAAGTTSRPTFEGSLKLSDGLLRGYGMTEPARDIDVGIAALNRAFTILEADASLGSGSVSVDGSYDLDSNGSFRLRTRLDSPELRITDTLDARLGGKVTWAGDRDRSVMSGNVDIEKAEVLYEFNIADLASRRVKRVAVRSSEDPRSRVRLDLEVNVRDPVSFNSNLANLELSGGVRISGTLLHPRPTGSFYTESGTFRYLGTEFQIETLTVSWRDPRRSDPYINVVAVADVEARSGDSYSVTVRFDDYWYDGTFSFTSTPPLSEPDVIALLTFGDTVGGVVSGGDRPGTSRTSFSEMARRTFVGRVFGVAESKLEDLLALDVVAIDEETTEEGSLVEGAGVTVGKRFGRVAVSYTTAVGRFEEREVEVSFFLTEHLSLVTKADPGGNHAARIKLHIPIE
ncbi:MAG: hypothetical protein GF405_09825 [Candidatus Eisenbacteria bacterium]|nr:hypothetical protein [Candidatus Eisenbacteria bacterium]